MNFFAHAVVAIGQSGTPSFVLGAMLPDLTGMAGVRVESLNDEQLELGVALHHETDRRFHGAPAFRALCESAVSTLEAQGVGRGTARAVGHVGSELLLDGVLSIDRVARDAYLTALEAGLQQELMSRVSLRGCYSGEPLSELLTRLLRAPLPQAYRDADFVADRVQWILAGRPRLALQTSDRVPVQRWLREAASHLERDAAELLAASR